MRVAVQPKLLEVMSLVGFDLDLCGLEGCARGAEEGCGRGRGTIMALGQARAPAFLAAGFNCCTACRPQKSWKT